MVDGQAAIVLHVGIGWHGPFDTEAEGRQFYEDNKAANPGWKPPKGQMDIVGQVQNAAGSVGDKAKQAVNAIPNALNSVGNDIKIWAVRIAEILLGIVLIGVALAQLTGTSNVVKQAAVGVFKK
jgi:hypothetical protein